MEVWQNPYLLFFIAVCVLAVVLLAVGGSLCSKGNEGGTEPYVGAILLTVALGTLVATLFVVGSELLSIVTAGKLGKTIDSGSAESSSQSLLELAAESLAESSAQSSVELAAESLGQSSEELADRLSEVAETST
ncbi:ABC transporter ATP-binding protein [Babesia caballi]|uniref:ABC transporter ATP-binding protein n=1 Tax=Babesia caballi TaxID=5871 RepID=A0AAV4LXK9_BABCB|nr:ABC transporter ATP-binding protein [Babesia caballi]